MSLLSAILPINAALGVVSTIARAVRPGSGTGFSAALRESLGEQFTNRWDSDKNGTVSPGEFPGKPELFAQWDRNADGLISAAEAHATLNQLVQARRIEAAARKDWALYDFDRSGGLTPPEAGLPQNEFGGLDTNGDGLLNRSEWFAARGLTGSGLIR